MSSHNKTAVRAPQGGPSSDADRPQDTAAPAAAASAERAAPAGALTQPRQRRRAGGKPAAAARQAATQEEQQAEFVDPCESMSWMSYYPRQYGGLSLGAAACYSTVACYDQADPLRVWKLCAWMLLAFLALAVHELRPFKRMNYGDRAREQGMGVRQAFGF